MMGSMTSQAVTPLARRNAALLFILKILEVGIGMCSLLGGVIVFIAPPPSFIRSVSIPWLIAIWGGLLLFGGFCAVVGRITDFWWVEVIGLPAMAAGAAIYAAVLTTAGVDKSELGTGVAVLLIIGCILAMAHRYVQLQIFTSEAARPDDGAMGRLRKIFARPDLDRA